MNNQSTIGRDIQELLNNTLKMSDPQAQVSVRRNSLGWLDLRVVTKEFNNLEFLERERKVDQLLKPMNFDLGKYPIGSYHLLSPEEVSEMNSSASQQLQLPLWSEVLMAPELEFPQTTETDEQVSTTIVTFYSFKGGVGRSTALALVAGMLANRKRRVVMIDFDLEAPGLTALFPENLSGGDEGSLGLLDYLHQRYLTPDKQLPKITDCIRQVESKSRGELFLLPAGEYNENYIHRLADLSIKSMYSRDDNPVHQLINDIKESLSPDVILIDARTGFDDSGAIALLDLADTGVICFTPTEQSFHGLRWIVRAARKQKDFKRYPDLRFLLTPMPPVAESQQKIWINDAEDWIEENWDLQQGTSVNELYYTAPYNPNVATISSYTDEVPKDVADIYQPLSDSIEASLPALKSPLSNFAFEQNRTALEELRFEAATAWDLNLADTSDIFQRTDDFPRFLEDRIWLIRGAKGTGKSLLFRLFIEQTEEAKNQAYPYKDLTKMNFVAGHGPSNLSSSAPILGSGDISSFRQQTGDDNWHSFWLNYALLQIFRSLEIEDPSNLTEDHYLQTIHNRSQLSRAEIVSWLVGRVNSPMSSPKATDELVAADKWLRDRGQSLWIFYDELDASFDLGEQTGDSRETALNALFSFWLENSASLQSIVPKLMLREDIWNTLTFTNKGHYATKDLELRWEEPDLWRLVLRQSLVSSETLRYHLDTAFGIKIDKIDNIHEDHLRRSLYPLWGERMGSTKKAFTHNWVRTRITDTQSNRFPRSLILLLQEAVKKEKDLQPQHSSDTILRPRALIEALPSVSKHRVEEIIDEYPRFDVYLKKLDGQRSPIEHSQLAEIWSIQGTELEELTKEMVEAGILENRSRTSETDERRYTVAELYLYGLNMIRKGQR